MDFCTPVVVSGSTLATENRDEAFQAVLAENERLAEENSRLQRETNRAHQKYSRSSLKVTCKVLRCCISVVISISIKLKECEDQIAMLTTRNEELERDLEEARFDLDKAQRQVNKLDYKLYTLAKVGILPIMFSALQDFESYHRFNSKIFNDEGYGWNAYKLLSKLVSLGETAILQPVSFSHWI